MCATWAAMNCPFLSRPLAKRDDRNIPAEATSHPDHADHNPGVTLVWWTRKFSISRHSEGYSLLFDIGTPIKMLWYREGRDATREEVRAAIDKGVPFLRERAEEQGEDALEELQRRYEKTLLLLPKAA
jgi:hypothetical protein